MKQFIHIFEDLQSDREFEYNFEDGQWDLNFPENLSFLATEKNEDFIAIAKLGLINDTIPITDHYISNVRIKYKLIPHWDSAGIKEIDFVLLYVYILGFYAVWDESINSDIEHEFEFEDIGPFADKIDNIEFIGLPYYPTNITINMDPDNNDNKPAKLDPSTFRYEFIIGY